LPRDPARLALLACRAGLRGKNHVYHASRVIIFIYVLVQVHPTTKVVNNFAVSK
jgi:hypothetical protein